MQISEAAKAGGVSMRSLRYYEDEGLIVPGRLDNGYRDYCTATIDRVLVVRSLLESGLPVRLIRQALDDQPGTGPDLLCAEFLREVQDYHDRLTVRIASLSTQQSSLAAFLREARDTA